MFIETGFSRLSFPPFSKYVCIYMYTFFSFSFSFLRQFDVCLSVYFLPRVKFLERVFPFSLPSSRTSILWIMTTTGHAGDQSVCDNLSTKQSSNKASNPSFRSQTMKPILVGIAGGSGSGKTTLSRAIVSALGAENVTYICHDYYYRDLSHLAVEERATQNFDHPDALETILMVEQLAQLKAGGEVDLPSYDFSSHTRAPATVRCDLQT